MEWQPFLVVTYSVLLTATIAGVLSQARRLRNVERQAERAAEHAARIESTVAEMRGDLKEQGRELHTAMTDFRVHMAEEAASVKRLEALIVSTARGRDREGV